MHRIWRALKVAAVNLAKLSAALLASGLVALWAVPYAYQERGYWDIGGEALLIAAVFVGTLWLIHICGQARRETKLNVQKK